MFSFLSYSSLSRGARPIHCAANVGAAIGVALFFGFSGTGKRALSTGPERTLIGDDEPGWSENVIVNIEDSCDAKAIDLSPESKPEILGPTRRFATVRENAALYPATRQPDPAGTRLIENTRVA